MLVVRRSAGNIDVPRVLKTGFAVRSSVAEADLEWAVMLQDSNLALCLLLQCHLIKPQQLPEDHREIALLLLDHQRMCQARASACGNLLLK